MMQYNEKTAKKLLANTDCSGDCWEWQGAKNKGYGVIEHQGKAYRTHRLSYEWFIEHIPEGMSVCHKCDNPACIRPDHLFVGTQQDNMDDMKAKGRGANCIHKGTKNGRSKLTQHDVDLIRVFVKRHPPTRSTKSPHFGSLSFLARWFGVTKRAIAGIERGEAWT